MQKSLINLYSEIQGCKICPKMDNFKMQRNINSVDINSTVFILSQALAEKQLRESGVNFFKIDGQVGDTGRELEKFLNQFHQTIHPPKDIILENGKIIKKKKDEFQSVYNTEITQCYPGKGKIKGDRLPEKNEIQNCINTGFLFSEINLIKPKIILLMGKLSTQTFYKYILKKECQLSLNTMINQIIIEGKMPTINIFDKEIAYLPIQHASPVNPNFKKMCKNENLITLINTYLR